MSVYKIYSGFTREPIITRAPSLVKQIVENTHTMFAGASNYMAVLKDDVLIAARSVDDLVGIALYPGYDLNSTVNEIREAVNIFTVLGFCERYVNFERETIAKPVSSIITRLTNGSTYNPLYTPITDNKDMKDKFYAQDHAAITHVEIALKVVKPANRYRLAEEYSTCVVNLEEFPYEPLEWIEENSKEFDTHYPGERI